MNIVEKLLTRLLDKIPSGWKSIVGIAAMLVLMVANQMQWLTADQYEFWFDLAVAVFGIGIFHKAVKGQTT